MYFFHMYINCDYGSTTKRDKGYTTSACQPPSIHWWYFNYIWMFILPKRSRFIIRKFISLYKKTNIQKYDEMLRSISSQKFLAKRDI